MSKNGNERMTFGAAFIALIAALLSDPIGWVVLFLLAGGAAAGMTSCNEYWSPRAWRGLPAIMTTKDLAGKTIRDSASKRCFSVVQQDGQPRFVPSDCPKVK